MNPLNIHKLYFKKALVRVFCHTKIETKYIEKSFFKAKSYSPYASPDIETLEQTDFNLKYIKYLTVYFKTKISTFMTKIA